jgi:hypothetical protein
MDQINHQTVTNLPFCRTMQWCMNLMMNKSSDLILLQCTQDHRRRYPDSLLLHSVL